MKRIRRVFLLIHIALWCIFTFLVTFQLYSEGDANWIAVAGGFMLCNLFVFYSHFYLLTTYQGRKKRKTYVLSLAGVILIAPLIFLLGHYRKLGDWQTMYEYYMMALITIVPAFLLLSWLARVTENLVIIAFKKEQLEKEAVEAELKHLKSQINPHFLFNTLHNIHTLVYKQASTAPEAVLRLASLMRYMIYESNATLVPLTREIDYLEDYISLQQLRYKKFPVVNLKIKGVNHFCHVAPLLFIHLLENAYKHSPARLEPGDIKVALVVESDHLVFEVHNPLAKVPQRTINEPGGIGLSNVRKRLQLLYPECHSLDICQSEHTFVTKLTIQGLKLLSDVG